MGQNALNDKGFTLSELLVALAMAAIVMTGVYSIYTYFIRSSSGQERLAEIQQEGRAAMERVVKELRAGGCYYKNTPIITATADTFEFESDTDPDPTQGPWMIRYSVDAATDTLTRETAAWNTGALAYGAYSAGQDVAGHVSSITFAYYDENGASIAAPITSQANRDTIRRVDVTLVTQTSEKNPVTNQFDSISIKSSVYLRCMGVSQSTDTTACAVPTALSSSDSGVCGRLSLTWTKSTSSDAAGYKVYYRANGESFYSGLVSVAGGSTQSYTLAGLQDGTQYDIALSCYDTAGNESAMSSAITGTSGPDTRPDDITAPELPAGTDSTAGDTYVTLSWTASTSVDAGGYDIMRSSDSGSTYTAIAEVGSTVLTYTDTAVSNCPSTPYMYKVITWDCAANKKDISEQTAVAGDAAKSGGMTDTPVNNTTNTYPTETTVPADPSAFTAIAGADKVYLAFTTPSSSDLKGVRILRRTDQYPTAYNDGAAIGPNNTPDYAPLAVSQTYALQDTYSIILGTTYYYSAFSYDNCDNYSSGTTSSAQAKPCGDGAVGSDHYGAPMAPTGLTPSVCSTAAMSWAAPAGSALSGLPFDPASENDVVGYYIYRSTTSGVYGAPLNASPVTSESYSDSTVTTDGATYYYVVKAVDCAVNLSAQSGEIAVYPSDIAWDTGLDVLTYATSGITGSQHNIVRLGIKTSANTSLTLNNALITWPTATAYIKKITLKPYGGSTNTLWDDSSLPYTASGSSIDFAGYQSNAALRRIAAASTLNELVIEFRDSSGNGTPDMRGATINLTFGYTNDGAGSSCSSSSFDAVVPSGPGISSTTQNRPVEPTTSNLTAGTVVVPAGTQDASYVWTLYTVKASSVITPETGTTLSSAKLYYQTTNRSTTTAPATDYSAAPSGWTALNMCQVGSTDTYLNETAGACSSSAIPNNPNKRIWYYIKATDSKTNYDIQPEPLVGMYSYDQDAKFSMVLWSGRGNSATYPPSFTGDRKYVFEWIYLTNQDSSLVTGATATITVKASDGTPTETGAMTDCATNYCAGLGSYYPGWYYYAATNTYSDKTVKADVTVTKSKYTAAKCGDSSVSKDIVDWDTVTCN